MKKHVLIYFLLFVTYCQSEWEDISIICPNQCVCQRSYFNDLPISRWIMHFDNILDGKTHSNIEDDKSEATKNEAYYEDDKSHHKNRPVKFVMCMVQADTNVKALLMSIPQDVNALSLLYTGSKTNYTVLTSDISLPDLEILEIRGNAERDLSLVIDVALSDIHYVNFESIRISCGSKLARRKIAIDPSKDFDYVPVSEKVEYNVTMEEKDDVEILPYEVYIQELKRSRAISFYGWNELRILRIHECKLDELDWEIFDGLDKLQHLSLEHNGIKIVPAFTFFGVPHIKTLSLARNAILDLNYRALAGLLSLKSLDLSYNEISKLSELTFPPFPKLEVIDIRHNPIKYIFSSSFAVVNATLQLYMGDENIAFTITGRETFKDMKKLKKLHITNINQTTFSQNLLSNLKSLEILKIKGRVKYIEFDAFAEVEKLKELIASNCQTEELSMDAFYGLTEIEIIDLSNNKLQFLPPGIFDDKKSLREIYLSANQFQRLPKNFFGTLHSNVKMVRLTDNPWICSCAFTTWKQGLINRQRSTKHVSHCKTNKSKYQSIKCGTNEYNYIYDNKMSPRCAGPTKEIQGKSVFYALRRVLKCPTESKTLSRSHVDLLEEKRKIRLKNKLLREKHEKHVQDKLTRENNELKMQANLKHYASIKNEVNRVNSLNSKLTAKNAIRSY